MSHRTSTRLAAVLLAATLPLAACVDESDTKVGETSEDLEESVEAKENEKPSFNVEETDPKVTDKITGESVEDPAMELSYKWQGTSTAPGGGSIVVVALTNNSDAPLPVDALTPKLRYNTGSSSSRDLKDATFEPIADEAGVDIVGLDQPLGPGATVNAKYPFDVSVGNLWDAEFTIGNVTFKGNLNN